MKKFNFNFNPKFNINIKFVIFGISTLIFIYLLYLSIPSLYKSGRVQKVLSDEILSEFNLNISLSPDITTESYLHRIFLLKILNYTIQIQIMR